MESSTTSNPTSLDQFLALCRENPDLRLDATEASVFYGVNIQDRQAFFAQYLPRRVTISVGELIPFIEHGNKFWLMAMRIAAMGLRYEGLLSRDFNIYDDRIVMPSEPLPDGYRVPKRTRGRGGIT